MGSQRRLTDGLEGGAYRAAAALRGAADDAADALAHERDRAAAVLAAAADAARSSLPGFGGDSPPFGRDARRRRTSVRAAALGTEQEKGDSTSLQRECSARDCSRESIHASRALREMIARPIISRNEWNSTEI